MGKALPVNIEEEMQRSYIDYAMSVIVARALPDARDGLKPVHRRILYAMLELGLTPDKPFKKSARVVGEVLGKYHPHGEPSVYEAAVRLAQDFSTRYLLVEGHGNFGSVDGDPAAAMRYTEVRLSHLAMEMLADIRKETVDFVPNFDDSLQEPVVLPSRFPNLLVNGSSGIAVGMATNIPPHNLREVVDGLLLLIDRPDAGVPELMKSIRGPDFPTGGQILGTQGIKDAYTTGRGLLRVRAQAEIGTTRAGRTQIVVTEIPYQVSKARLLEKIAELVRERRIDGITDLRDESDRRGLRVVMELRRDASPQVILNRLFKFTPLEQTFGVIMLALVGGEPRVLTLPELLRHYLDHQKDVVVRRTRYDLARAEERAHILAGLRIALDNLDRVVEIIRGSPTVESARERLMQEFSLSQVQAQAILDMRLARLVGLERKKVEDEYAEIVALMERLRAILASEAMVWRVVKEELTRVRDRFGDPRRTRIVRAPAELEPEDLIAREQVVVTLTHQGYVKRTPLSTYRSQRRGGRGLAGATTREEDFLERLFIASTHDHLLFFTSRAKVYRLRAYDLPEMGRQAKGVALVNLLQLVAEERVAAVIPVGALDESAQLLMVTRRGRVKRIALEEFAHARRTGLVALRLKQDDGLVAVLPCAAGQHAVLVTRLGRGTRFPVEEVRPQGREASGVTGMRLQAGDAVVSAGLVQPGAALLLVTAGGQGKRTPLSAFRSYHRGTQGVRAINVMPASGPVAGAVVVGDDDGAVLVSASGILIRLRVREVSQQGRSTRGVSVMRLDPGDTVVAVARVVKEEEGGIPPGGDGGRTGTETAGRA